MAVQRFYVEGFFKWVARPDVFNELRSQLVVYVSEFNSLTFKILQQ